MQLFVNYEFKKKKKARPDQIVFTETDFPAPDIARLFLLKLIYPRQIQSEGN